MARHVTPGSRPLRVLALSGGGVRGIFQAVYLNKIHKALDTPLHRYFDIIAGTSTGAIVGLAVALGKNIETVVEFYQQHAATVFSPQYWSWIFGGPRYDQTILRDKLATVFTTDRLVDCKCKVLVTAACLDQFGHHVFSTLAGQTNPNLSVVEVALASAAAPTYFSPVKPSTMDTAFIDGGVWASSPALLAVLEGHRHLDEPFKSMRLLSLGNGDFPSGYTCEEFNSLRPYSPTAISSLFDVMFASQESFANDQASHLIGRENFLRVTASLGEKIHLDDVETALNKLPALAEKQAEDTLDDFKRLFCLDDRRASVKAFTPHSSIVLASKEMIGAAGLIGVFASRSHYSLHRPKAASIAAYVATARKSITLVSVNLMTGMPFEGLCGVLEAKLKQKRKPLSVVVSLLDPRRKSLMEAMAPVLEKEPDALSASIMQTFRQLLDFRAGLPPDAQKRLDIRAHPAIPFGSAILLDHRERYGRLQVETKPYKAPFNMSFAFEFAPVSADGLYRALVTGFETLVKDGESIDVPQVNGILGNVTDQRALSGQSHPSP